MQIAEPDRGTDDRGLQTSAKKARVTKSGTAAGGTGAGAKKKRTSPKASVAASLAVAEGDEPWTEDEVGEVLAELHEHRDRLDTLVQGQEEELAGLMRDAGDGAGHDQADVGATSFERDHELTVVNNERETLQQIDHALARIADGTYGRCESCGNPIGKARQMAFPRASLCLACKQREERR